MLSTNDSSSLLGEFAEPSLQQWRQEVERLLKGAPFARKMFSRTWEGITVGPMYTAADMADIPWLDSLPGQAPFVRGNTAAGYHGAPWLVAQECRRPTAEQFNQSLRSGLARGQTAVNLIFDQASMQGHDPDQVPLGGIGCRGTSIGSLTDLSTALADIDLGATPLFLQAGGSALQATALLAALLKRSQTDLDKLRGCVGSAPSSGLGRLGQIATSVSQTHDESAILSAWAVRHAPHLRTVPVYEGPWHDGGADLALSLALTLAEAVSALREMEARGLGVDEIAPRVQFNLEIGSDFFMEMAKLRALRLLWSRLLVASGVAPENTRTFVHARTARRCQTVLDPHVNMLRATTGAMSAILGGVDSLHVSPFDEVDRLPDEFSLRIARNVQLVLAHECHLDQVVDPAGGSWYVESLTRDLAAATWAKFQAVEQAGGLPAVLASGWAQEQIASAATERARAYATRRQVRVGTNKYPDPMAEVLPVKEQDYEKLHRERAASIAGQRTTKTREAHLLVVNRLEKIMECPANGVFEALVAAAEVGATLGELAGALRGDSTPSLAVESVPLRRDSEPFEILRARTLAVRGQDPAAGRVFMACLGDSARYMPRLEFAREFCHVGGFEVVGDDFYASPKQAVVAAVEAGVGTVLLVGRDEAYDEQAEIIARDLAAAGERLTVVLAGAPGANEAAWRAAGVHEFIHLGCDALAVLSSLLDRKGGQS